MKRVNFKRTKAFVKVYLGIMMSIFTISLLACIWFCISTLPAMCSSKQLAYVECNESYEYNALPVTYTREQAKAKISSLFGNPAHIYSEKNFPGRMGGQTILFFRWVQMDSDCDMDAYIYSYAHELVHLTEKVSNERYTNYRTFIKLYESGDEQLKAVAERYLYNDLKGYSAEAYTCGYYILKYLQEND